VTTVDLDFLFRKTPRNLSKRPGPKRRLAALERENERGVRDLIRRWQALPPERRTNFLRKGIAFGRSAL
jgi:hypothetical protein